MHLALRDACIQRFEFCIELAWKTSIKVLGLETKAPNPAIRDMAQNKLIDDTQVWFDFLLARSTYFTFTKNKMKYGLTESEFQFLLKNAIEPLKALNAKVYLFGSRANGKFKKFSDIDLLYQASPDRKIGSHEIYAIIASLENSSFPYKVDLVSANELAESYRASVKNEKIEL